MRLTLPKTMVQEKAYFLPGNEYRVWLMRDLDPLGLLSEDPRALLAVLMNPSRAGHFRNDRTTKFMMSFASNRNFSLYGAVNLEPAVEPDSAKLIHASDEIWELNRLAIEKALKWVDDHNGQVITGWGTIKSHGDRLGVVKQMLKGRTLWRFGENKDGSPRFPKFIPFDTEPEEWTIS